MALQNNDAKNNIDKKAKKEIIGKTIDIKNNNEGMRYGAFLENQKETR